MRVPFSFLQETEQQDSTGFIRTNTVIALGYFILFCPGLSNISSKHSRISTRENDLSKSSSLLNPSLRFITGLGVQREGRSQFVKFHFLRVSLTCTVSGCFQRSSRHAGSQLARPINTDSLSFAQCCCQPRSIVISCLADRQIPEQDGCNKHRPVGVKRRQIVCCGTATKARVII